MSLPLPSSESVLSFALTYWVHSAVLTALAWLVIRSLKPRSNPVREAIWTAALFGAFVTTAMQTTGGVASRLATFQLPERALAQSHSSESHVPRTALHPERTVGLGTTETPAPRSLRRNASPESIAANPPASTPRGVMPDHSPDKAADRSGESKSMLVSASAGFERVRAFLSARVLTPLRTSGGTLLMVGSALGALWLAWLFVRSRSALAGRIPLIDHPLNGQLERLRARFGLTREVALSLSDRIATPVAFGIRRFEICVPERVLSDLDDRQREAMLAHELAHLVRNDPLRLLLARAVESIFFFQPLHRLARRELFEVIERRCDAYAVERLGGGLALAGCLAEVASWLATRPRRALAPAMAESKSALCRRIEQLLDEDATLELERRQRGFAPLVIAAVPLVALVVPGFAVAHPERTTQGVANPASAPTTAREDLAILTPERSRLAFEAAATDAIEPGSDELDEVDLDEVVELLDAEIGSLGDEIAELRSLLGDTRDPRFEPALEALEDRLELLEERRISLAALWRARTDGPTGVPSDSIEVRDDEARRNR